MNAMPIRAAGRDIPDALDRIRRYCGLPWSGGPPETWAYRYYDKIPTPSDNDVSPVDVLAAAALHPGLSRQDLAFFHERNAELGDWLDAVPPDVDLGAADDALLEHLSSLVEIDAEASVTLLTKVLHRKRPRLIPLLDRHVIDWYRPVTGERSAAKAWRPVLVAMRHDVSGDSGELLEGVTDVLRVEISDDTPSNIRLIDIAVWMGAQR